jgi:hypothetical protein
MPISSVVKNFANGTLTLSDDTGTPITVTVQYEAGDFALSGVMQGQKEVAMYLDRGAFGSLRKTNFTPATFSFTAHMTDISDGTNKTLPDAVNKTGAFAAGVSTLGAGADVPWTLDLLWTIEGTDSGDASDHTVTMTDCHLKIDMSEGDPNSFSISGTVYGSITLA